MYADDSDQYGSGSKGQEVMISYDVDVFAAKLRSFRVCVHAAACHVRRANFKNAVHRQEGRV